MQTHIATTPFGRRPMSLGSITSQLSARTMSPEASANKWQVFQHIREARDALGATDRSLAILNALLSFHKETTLTGETDLIVWPSNEHLMARANGMSATTLRRHLAVLVDGGLIIRRDSPNGKRFARKGRGGEIEQAYGFDLSPIVARADEFRSLAETIQADKKAYRVAKERLTLLRRDIVKMIDTAIEEGVPGHWNRVLETYQATISRLPRTASHALVETVCMDLHDLWTEIRELLESFAKSKDMDGNESHSGRHIQNSKPDSNFESEHGFRERKEAVAIAAETDNLRSLPKRELPLGIVLDACPDLLHVAKGADIRQWRDFMSAAENARPMLGISPSAWFEACKVMGGQQASITVAAMYQRSGEINNAGGYLRNLTERARENKFSAWPMIMALLRAKLDKGKVAVGSGDERGDGMVDGNSKRKGDLDVSAGLLKSLQKPGFR